jgi:hypothetical protein
MRAQRDLGQEKGAIAQVATNYGRKAYFKADPPVSFGEIAIHVQKKRRLKRIKEILDP